jgi:sugar phosphate isomerase/epimerase
MYSLSTCWNSHRHTDGRAMLREIRDLGFAFAELSHGIRLSLLPGILEAVDAGEIRISSLHNFCPLPIGITRAAPNIFRFTAADPREREQAFRQTLKTLDTAARVNAPAVVLHLGSIEMKDYSGKLEDLLAAGQRDTPRYLRLAQEAEEVREQKKETAVDLANEMLARLIPEAEQRGVRLGIENREALEEIPLDTDFPQLFKKFPSPVIGYWHDCGHAQIKENLGFVHHVMHLETLAPRLYGFHIHDVQLPARDHCPPGSGTIHFAALQPFVRPEHIKVLELSPGVPPEDVRRGFDHIRNLWGPE